MTEHELKNMIENIRPLDETAIKAALERQSKLAKPPKSLGKLEDISVKLAGITGRVENRLDKRCVIVFAADNGVVKEGVAVTPQSVTLKQSVNMTRRKTGMSALAAFFGDDVKVVDVGIASELRFPGISDKKVRPGTGDILLGPAMTRDEAMKAISAGIETVNELAANGVELIGVGEMGIGNTTTSAAVLASLLGKDPDAVTGRGSGLTDEAFELKKRVIRGAIELNKPDPVDVIDVISKVGGLDIAAMTGAYLACASNRIPAVVDGFISITAALCAVRLCPIVKDHVFLSHVSEEPGYRFAAEAIVLEPFLLLDMRLGEGSGCPIAFQIMRAACAVMKDMATFEEASIDDGYLDAIKRVDAFGKRKQEDAQ